MAVAVAESGVGRDRGKVKTSLWPCVLELSGFLFPQWASVTQRSIWISFPALCVDPGLSRVCPGVIPASGGLLPCWRPDSSRPHGQQYIVLSD